MANYNLEELILEGKSKVGLAALGFTKEEIENAQANIEKKKSRRQRTSRRWGITIGRWFFGAVAD